MLQNLLEKLGLGSKKKDTKETHEKLHREEGNQKERYILSDKEKNSKQLSTPIITPAANQKSFINSIGMEFVQMPAGTFDMVSPANETDRWDSQGPVHSEKISNAFYMGKYEVTQKQWRDVMGSNPSYFKGDNLPVETVSWNDVQSFITKLNEKEGGNKYRLPSEAEWEYAARAGTTTRFSFGDDETILDDYAWYSANSGSKTHDVGQKKPNPWGLYDMHGNVWERVQDNGDILAIILETFREVEWVQNKRWENDRAIRGGSFRVDSGFCRSADRYNGAAVSCNDFGFRLLRIL